MINVKIFIIIVFVFYLKGNIFSQSEIEPVSTFGTNPGNLNMYIYAPQNLTTNCGLVVALHGCTQTAADCANSTGWNDIADKHNLIIIYPEQKYLNNYSYCFNWFLEGDITRESGEAKSIKEMVDYAKANYSINNSNVYVTGLSAGGAMTAVMMATYPDVFAAGAVMAGGPYKAATDAITAISAMNGSINKTPDEWKTLVQGAFPTYSGTYPKLCVFHGNVDYTVNIANCNELMEQWTAINNADATVDITNSSFFENADVTQRVYLNSQNDTTVVTYIINNMGHAIAVSPGICLYEGGATQTYSVDKNFYSTYWAARFFGIISNPNLNISGSTSVLENETGTTYSVPFTTNSTYTWSIPSSATIVSGQGTNQITVNWGNTSGEIHVKEVDVEGCKTYSNPFFVDVVLSSNENIDNESEFSVYPNPFQKYIYLKNLPDNELLKAEIVDEQYKKIMDLSVRNKQLINLSKIPDGTYIIRVFSGKNLLSKKIIKTK